MLDNMNVFPLSLKTELHRGVPRVPITLAAGACAPKLTSDMIGPLRNRNGGVASDRYLILI